MKKIVALVLAMVMVLGLATTAFAATTSTGSVVKTSVTVKNPAMYALSYTTGKTEVAATITDIEKTTVSGKVVDDVAKYVPTVYDIDGTVYIEVAKASATFELKNNGVSVYLAEALGCDDADDAIEKYATDVVVATVVPGVEVPSCGDEKYGKTYFVSTEGDLYYVGGVSYAYANGEFMGYDADANVAANLVPHTWKASKVTYRGTDALGHAIPVSIVCDECDVPFSVVYKSKFNNTWVAGVNYDYSADAQAAVGTDYYIVLKDVVASTPVVDTDKVESPKTFDAGIAMYVGMSVMAAAGSAVVLKKKD